MERECPVHYNANFISVDLLPVKFSRRHCKIKKHPESASHFCGTDSGCICILLYSINSKPKKSSGAAPCQTKYRGFVPGVHVNGAGAPVCQSFEALSSSSAAG